MMLLVEYGCSFCTISIHFYYRVELQEYINYLRFFMGLVRVWCIMDLFLDMLLSVAVVTVNDYLAQRDAEWMGRVHRFLGLSVGLIQVIFFLKTSRTAAFL